MTVAAFSPASSRVLTAAFHQWANRPADQRFSSLETLHAAVSHHRETAVEAKNVHLAGLRVEVRSFDDEDLEPVLVSKTGLEARFTHHGFGSLARRVSAPASYLRQLPAELAAMNMNYGLGSSTSENDALLFAENGSLRLRAALSGSYQRIWNNDVTARLLRLCETFPEWQPAPAAFDGSRGLYASDSDLFAFMVNNDRRIFEELPGGGLSRGFFVSNSEVGAGSFVVTTFRYEWVCGNHRVWGARNVAELRIPHVGKADEKAFSALGVELVKYADGSSREDEAKIVRARAKELGATKDEVLDAVFGLRVRDLPRKTIEAAYDLAVEREDWYGNPRSVWGFTGGLTEVARDLPIASERVALERAAGKVLEIAF